MTVVYESLRTGDMHEAVLVDRHALLHEGLNESHQI